MQLLTSTFDSFGLDIGDRSLKAAYIKKHGSDFKLNHDMEASASWGVIMSSCFKR